MSPHHSTYYRPCTIPHHMHIAAGRRPPAAVQTNTVPIGYRHSTPSSNQQRRIKCTGRAARVCELSFYHTFAACACGTVALGCASRAAAVAVAGSSRPPATHTHTSGASGLRATYFCSSASPCCCCRSVCQPTTSCFCPSASSVSVPVPPSTPTRGANTQRHQLQGC